MYPVNGSLSGHCSIREKIFIILCFIVNPPCRFPGTTMNERGDAHKMPKASIPALYGQRSRCADLQQESDPFPVNHCVDRLGGHTYFQKNIDKSGWNKYNNMVSETKLTPKL